MAINLFPVTSDFAAEVGDVDLSKPLCPEDAEAIQAAFLKYAVLVFPGQQLNADQHVAFAERFGPLEVNINTYQDEVKAERIDGRISDVSNLDHENALLPAQSRKRMSGLANRLWHTDSIFRHVPARASLLYARIVAPIGGLTEFTDMRAAWDTLPEATRRQIDGYIIEHSIFHSRAKVGATVFTERERASLPPSKQVLVRKIPETGRRALYLASHAIRIMDLPEADSTRLIEDLMAHATQRQFVYSHRWRVDDLVVWDNRCTMHRGTRYEEHRWKRDMHRATVSDVGNTIEALTAQASGQAGYLPS
jgi:alpha-ketoglutarate-dependent 2,4-dichlorophenoxyacetate dioxygenase